MLLRLSSLDADAPGLTRALAVLGDGVSLCEAAALARIADEERAGALCDVLVRVAVLRRTERLEFVHPIVREAVYADLAPRERAAMHARAARALAATGAPAERVAAQLLETDPEGDPWVVERLREAAREAAAKGASETVVRYLRRALAEPPAKALRADVLLELGAAGARAGTPDALERLNDALEVATEEHVQASAAFELGRALFYFGRPAEAVEVIDRALARLADADRELRLELEALVLTQMHTTIASRRLILPRLERATIDLERSRHSRPEIVATLAMEKALNTGPAEEAVALAIRAFEEGCLLEEQTSESPAVYLGIAALRIADGGHIAEQYLDLAIADARERGSARGFAMGSANRGWTRYRRGNLRGAEADLRAFLALAPEAGADLLYPFGVGTLVQVLIDRGDQDGAAATLAELDVGRSDLNSAPSQELRRAKVRLSLLAGGAEEALVEALAIARWHDEQGTRHDAYPRWRPLVAQAHFTLGHVEEGAAIASEAVALAREYGADDYLGATLRVLAGLSALAEAVELLIEAVGVLERSQSRLEHAGALTDLGAALRRANRRLEAREPLERGLQLAERCGAAAIVERASEELEATGARPRRAVRSGIDALTPSERRIAQLAGRGKSNREIAQALFVTQKTVEMHLRNAYRKLDICSRRELPRTLVSAAETEKARRRS